MLRHSLIPCLFRQLTYAKRVRTTITTTVMAGKEATVYILDLGRSMGKKRHGRDQTDLDWALEYVWDKITNTVSRRSFGDLVRSIRRLLISCKHNIIQESATDNKTGCNGQKDCADERDWLPN